MPATTARHPLFSMPDRVDRHGVPIEYGFRIRTFPEGCQGGVTVVFDAGNYEISILPGGGGERLGVYFDELGALRYFRSGNAEFSGGGDVKETFPGSSAGKEKSDRCHDGKSFILMKLGFSRKE